MMIWMSFWHSVVAEVDFYLKFFLSCLSLRREKSMSLLQHNGRENAVFVFVAASRSDRARHSARRGATGHLSLNRSLKNFLFCLCLIYANLYLCVYLCVCEHAYIQEYVYGRHCL